MAGPFSQGFPLVLATRAPGTELRRPLGITIIGGLFVSQILTLYTTPVIYLLIDPAAADDPRPDAIAPHRLNSFRMDSSGSALHC